MAGEVTTGTTERAAVPELTWQAVVGAFIVSSVVALSYPYVVLKLGLGFNASLLTAFLGALFLHAAAARTRGNNRLMNNIIQTAGTSATATAFMCVIAAAFDYLGQNRSADVEVAISPLHMFLWLICSGSIGVLFIPLFRRYFLDDPNMVFADGVSAAETIQVLDSQEDEVRGRLRVLGASAALSGISCFLIGGLKLLPPLFFVKRFQIGIEWSLLSFGTGLLIGPRIALSVGLGTLIVALAGPTIIARDGLDIVNSSLASGDVATCDAFVGTQLSAEQTAFVSDRCGALGDYLAGDDFGIVLLWTMWPATALIVAAGLTAVALQWRSIAGMFRAIASRGPAQTRDDISLRTTIVGVVVLAIILAFFRTCTSGCLTWRRSWRCWSSCP